MTTTTPATAARTIFAPDVAKCKRLTSKSVAALARVAILTATARRRQEKHRSLDRGQYTLVTSRA
jgi:hypothetical protein